MINLIPNEEKKRKAHNFYYRLIILSFFMLGIVMCFAVLAILPSYILVAGKDNFVNEKLSMQKAEPVPILGQQTLSLIKELDNKLSLIENIRKDKFVVSAKIINEILESRVANVKITRISYENDELSGRKIGIYGTAPSRERLLLFRQALEDNPAFKNVDLPISNFIRGSNISFFLSLAPSGSPN